MTSPKKHPQVTLRLTELRDLVAPIIPHADDGLSLPVLGCVKFETRDGWLLARASDRYTIGISRHRVGPDVDFNCLVQAAELKAMLAMFKPGRADDNAVTLTIDGAFLRVKGASAMFAEATVSYNIYQGEYPKTDGILAGHLGKAVECAPWGINGAFLVRFNAARRNRREPLLFSRSKAKPMFVRVGDHFLGAIMPVNPASADGAAAGEWTDIFGPEPEAVAS